MHCVLSEVIAELLNSRPPKVNNKIHIQKTLLTFSLCSTSHPSTLSTLLFNVILPEGRAGTAWERQHPKNYLF
jgi:hypothetical protein